MNIEDRGILNGSPTGTCFSAVLNGTLESIELIKDESGKIRKITGRDLRTGIPVLGNEVDPETIERIQAPEPAENHGYG